MNTHFLLMLATALVQTSAEFDKKGDEADSDARGAGQPFIVASIVCLAISDALVEVSRQLVPIEQRNPAPYDDDEEDKGSD